MNNILVFFFYSCFNWNDLIFKLLCKHGYSLIFMICLNVNFCVNICKKKCLWPYVDTVSGSLSKPLHIYFIFHFSYFLGSVIVYLCPRGIELGTRGNEFNCVSGAFNCVLGAFKCVLRALNWGMPQGHWTVSQGQQTVSQGNWTVS